MDSTKACKDCGHTKKIDEFYVSSVRQLKSGESQTYYSSRCRPCHTKRTHTTGRKLTDSNLLRIWRHFESNPCVDCGEDNPVVLSFDHRDRSKKAGTIGNMMKLSWPAIAAEIAKCDVRCMNCHAIKTAAEMNWFKAPELRDYVVSWPTNQQAYKRYAA